MIWTRRTILLWSAALVAVVMTIVWYSVIDFRSFLTGQHQLASKSVDSVAREIELLIAERRRTVALFIDREEALLRSVLDSGDGLEGWNAFGAQADRYFPGRFAVTITDREGRPLLNPGSELVGGACRQDIRSFSSDGPAHYLYVHPSPGTNRRHFDVMQQFGLGNGEEAVFFVSFYLDDVLRLLAHGQVMGHHLVLVRSGEQRMIEVAAGETLEALEKLAGTLETVPSRKPGEYRTLWSHSLDQHVLAHGLVEGTEWELRDIAGAGLIEHRRTRLYMQAVAVLAVFAVMVAAAVWLGRRLGAVTEDTNTILVNIEDDRRRLAMDLHDEVLSDLGHVRRECRRCLAGEDPAADFASRAQSIDRQLDRIADSIRTTINDLHPRPLELLGFSGALRSLCDSVNGGAGLPVVRLVSREWDDSRLSSSEGLHLFRIIQEILNNSVRHSGASQVTLEIEMGVESVMINVTDDGRGLTPGRCRLGHGYGIANVKARARLLEARTTWIRGPDGDGCRFALSMELTPHD